ncbi:MULTISPECIES: cytochrome oxidase putative small subunit CydP [unclassified Pseudomonas]
MIKLFIILLIKFIWFAHPTLPALDTQPIVERVLGSGEKPSEGEPR